MMEALVECSDSGQSQDSLTLVTSLDVTHGVSDSSPRVTLALADVSFADVVARTSTLSLLLSYLSFPSPTACRGRGDQYMFICVSRVPWWWGG